MSIRNIFSSRCMGECCTPRSTDREINEYVAREFTIVIHCLCHMLLYECIVVLPACRIRCTRLWQTFVAKDSRTFSFVFVFLRNTRSIIKRKRNGKTIVYLIYRRCRVWNKRSIRPKGTIGRTIRAAVPRLSPDTGEGLCICCRRGRVPRRLGRRKPGLDSCTCVAAFSWRSHRSASTPTTPTKLSTRREPCSWSL